jgi:hypothetical protein
MARVGRLRKFVVGPGPAMKRHSPDQLPRHSCGALAFDTGHFGWAKTAVFPRRLSNRIFNAHR